MPSIAVVAEGSGINEVLAAASGYRYEVFGYKLMAEGDIDAEFRSGASTVLDTAYVAERGGAVLPVAPLGDGREPWFETAVGEALNVNLSDAGIDVSVLVVYRKVKV